MKRKRVAMVLLGLAIGASLIAAVAWQYRRAEEERFRHPQNHYGVLVASRYQEAQAARRREEYLRRARQLRAAFEPFARQHQAPLQGALRGENSAHFLPRDPEQAIAGWKRLSDSLSAQELESRLSEAFVFSWNAATPDRKSLFRPQRHNVVLAESLIGKEAICFWLDGTITEEDRFGTTKTTHLAKPLNVLAPPYDFLSKGH